MPRKKSFVVTNNPIGKDRLEDVRPRGKWQYTSCEGGHWHDLEPEIGEFPFPGEEFVINQLFYPENRFAHRGYWFASLVGRLGYKVVVFHALRFPDGKEWDAVNGWREPIKASGPEGGVAGPMY